MAMTSNQPYLLRAFYEWILDNDLTPYLVVDANVPDTVVPQQHVHDGQIVLNVSPSACAKLNMGNEYIMFEARFGGVAMQIQVPCQGVLAIYAKENGAGTVFTPAELAEDNSDGNDVPPPPKGKAKKGPPSLKVVK